MKYFCRSYWKFVEKHHYLPPHWDPTCINMYHVDTHTFIKRKSIYIFDIIHVSRILDITDCFQKGFFCQIMTSFIGYYYCFNDSLNNLNMKQTTWDRIICFRCWNEVTGLSLRDGPLMYLHHDTVWLPSVSFSLSVFALAVHVSIYMCHINSFQSHQERNELAGCCSSHAQSTLILPIWLICWFGAAPVQLVLAGALAALPKSGHWRQATVILNAPASPVTRLCQLLLEPSTRVRVSPCFRNSPLKHNTATQSNLPQTAWLNTSRVSTTGDLSSRNNINH